VKKDLAFYLGLNYKIEISAIPGEDGGGFEACIPELGKYAFRGYGKTIHAALKDLNEIKTGNFEEYLQTGIQIPDPVAKSSFRGEFLLRMPPVVHKELSEAARDDGMSLNQYINFLITRNYQLDAFKGMIIKCLEMTWLRGWEASLPKTNLMQFHPGSEEEKLIGA